MGSKQEIVEQARHLGELLAANEVVQHFRAAQQAVQNDAAAQEMLQKYSQQASRIQQLEAGGQPVEVADKQALAEIERGMAGNDALKDMMRWQADYLGLMNAVNEAMSAPLADESAGGQQS
jgi:cell fate (sporulation/competence/biofilm development) regulator YlbF (YheA/YmcA/DUF963 family)